MKYESELSDYVKSLNLTHETLLLIGRANYDLNFGPLYLDEDGEYASCFDEGATQFDFSAACDKISTALGDVPDLWIDTFAGDWSTRDPASWLGEDYGWDDWLCMNRSEVLAYIVGKELVSYVS